MYRPIDADVIIIGGGIAGLTAAYTLVMKEPTLSVIVLEAGERLGGRALSVPLLYDDGKGLSTFDVGGQYVCGAQIQLIDLLEQLEIDLLPRKRWGGNIIAQYNEETHVVEQRKHILNFLSKSEKRQFSKFIKCVETSCKKIVEHQDDACREKLSKITLENFIHECIGSDVVQDVIDKIVHTSCGVHPSEMSALFYIFYCISTKGIVYQLPTEESNLYDYRIKGGTEQVCDKIIQFIGRDNICANETVTDVNCQRDYAEVTTERNCYSCYDVIVTVPPKDLRKINFFPSLPIEKIQAGRKTATNTVTNFVIIYPRHFWFKKGLSGDIYVFDKDCTKGPIDFCMNISTRNKPALSGRILGGSVTNQKQPVYKKEVLQQLCYYFGEEALHPSDYYEKSWNRDSKIFAGQMSCWKRGIVSYIDDMKTITNGRIYWAGADISPEWYGHLAGAVHSGMRAALEVLYDIRPAILSTDDMLVLTIYCKKVASNLVKQCSRLRSELQPTVVKWRKKRSYNSRC